MTRSLRGRFALVALATAAVTVATLGYAVQGLFERHTEREVLGRLDADLRYLGRGLVVEGGAATLRVEPLPDPRFREPFSGLYWQVRSDRTGEVLRSASLAGFELPLEPDELRPGELHRHIARGPEGTKMIVLERRIADAPEAARAWRVAVAVDRKVLEAADRAFVLDLLPVLAGIAAGLLAASALQGAIALRPIAEARRALGEVRAGRRDRLGASLPSELEGLAADFDALLEGQRRGARVARERAADLAHGLRTPLALLGARARDLRERGTEDAAAEIEAVTAGIDARLARELARAHIHGPGGGVARVRLAPLAGRIAGALARTPRGDELAWRADVPPDLVLAADESDLTELLGSLLENAAKWARSEVRVAAAADGGAAVVVVEDDGPGIPPHERRAALVRGTRLDPARGGTGLGLAIAQDIAAAYGGELRLEDGAAGGLRVRVTLPLATASAGPPAGRDRKGPGDLP